MRIPFLSSGPFSVGLFLILFSISSHSDFYAYYSSYESDVYDTSDAACLALGSIIYPDHYSKPIIGSSGDPTSSSSAKCKHGSASYDTVGTVLYVEDQVTEEPGVCSDSISCREYSLSQASYCLDGTRDFLTFFYVSPSDFSSECNSCSGPTSSQFSECNSSACNYGLNAQTGSCWSADCPYGDCVDPTDSGSTTGDPIASGGDIIIEVTVQGGDLTVINESIVNLRNDLSMMQPDLEELVSLTEDMIRENGTNTTGIKGSITSQTMTLDNSLQKFEDLMNITQGYQLAELNRISNTLTGFSEDYNDNNLPGSSGGEGHDNSDVVAALLRLREINISIGCEDRGEVYVPSLLPDGVGTCEAPGASYSYTALDTDGLSGLSSAINESSIGSSVSTMTSVQITVSSECGGAFKYSLPTGDLPLISKDMSIDLCVYLNPITPYLRIISLMFWSILGLRIILDA